MPLYEMECQDCKEVNEIILRNTVDVASYISSKEDACTKCGCRKFKKLMSSGGLVWKNPDTPH